MKVKILTPVQHDGTDFADGDTADLPNAAAKLLIDVGAAEVFDPAAAKAAAKAKADADAVAADEAAAAAKVAADEADAIAKAADAAADGQG